jgi:hypothetical protein
MDTGDSNTIMSRSSIDVTPKVVAPNVLGFLCPPAWNAHA